MDTIQKRKFSDIFSNLSPEESMKTALVCAKESFTYSQFGHAIALCASDLIDRGVQPGDRVGIWSFNSANALIAFFAIIRAGAVAVLCNYSMTYEEVFDQLSLTDVHFLLYGTTLINRKDPDMSERLCQALEIQGMDIRPEALSYLGRESEVAAHQMELDKIGAADDPHRDAFIIFTTGTTSKPKAVRDHQEGLMINAYRYIDFRAPLLGNSVCISLPHFHVFGLHMIISYLLKGATIYLSDKVGADSVVQTVMENGCTDIATVTAVYLKVIEHEGFNKISGQVKLLTTAGGALTPVQFMKLEMAFKGAKLFNEYGQTEAHGTVLMCRWDDPIEKRAFTVGMPYDKSEVVIRGADHEILPVGAPGEIEVKSLTTLNGYDKLPPEKQAVDSDGWLHTGDLGVFDQDGYVHLVGRAKDLIIKCGENIAPAEVENAVSELPGIEEVKVYGVKHNLWGESVECCVRLAEGAQFDEAACQNALKEKLASIKIPSHIIPFASFPVAPSGKLDVRGLRIQLVNIMKAMYMEQKIDAGMECLSLRIKSTEYNIVPASVLLRTVAESIGFDQKKIDKIALAVEEFLRIRITETESDVGDIQIRCIFHKDWLTIEFSDEGESYYIEKNKQTSLCARLILAVADNFVTVPSPTEATCYNMEFLYPKEINIKEFLLSKDREEL